MTRSAADRVLRTSLREATTLLRRREITAVELIEAAIECHHRLGGTLLAYRSFDETGAVQQARAADTLLDRAASARGDVAPPLCGIPISVKDIYGVDGFPTFAGSVRRLPDDPWAHDAWLVERARRAGAVIMGKTHTVEFAFGGVGINPHWDTPRNPWDPDSRRVPGGSSCGAGVSLWERSAMVALGSDTGGSIRIPAAFTGVVGHKTTHGLWSTRGVVQLSHTFDTVGALTRSVEDSAWFFGSVDPRHGNPSSLLNALSPTSVDGLIVGLPGSSLWEACQWDIHEVLKSALDELAAGGAVLERVDGSLVDEAMDFYLSSGIGKAELNGFLEAHLPGAIEHLHPTVGHRIADPLPLDSHAYRRVIEEQQRLASLAGDAFENCDALVLPANLLTAPLVDGLADDLTAYGEVNLKTLQPTCPVNLLGLCAVSVPVGLDQSGMPVGLQIIGRHGEDEAILGIALAMEKVLGPPEVRLGVPSLSR